jgi:hypothetical protein
VLEKAKEYLGTDHSYAKTVTDRRMPIMYDDRNAKGQKLPEGLAPSTVWRWLSWLGKMQGTLQAAMELIWEKEPNTALHREVWDVPTGKYRSLRRQNALQQVVQLLVIDRLCARLFGRSLFPHYAMSQGWS